MSFFIPIKNDRKGIIISILLTMALTILFFVGGLLYGKSQKESDEEIIARVMDEYDVLPGGTLRSMMNEAKYFPGLATIYAQKYPMYAYLFDGSFVTYIEGE